MEFRHLRYFMALAEEGTFGRAATRVHISQPPLTRQIRQLEERARGKLERKNLDLIAANNLKVAGAGFGTDTNVITLIDKQQTRHLEQMSKEAAAMEILTVLRDMMK